MSKDASTGLSKRDMTGLLKCDECGGLFNVLHVWSDHKERCSHCTVLKQQQIEKEHEGDDGKQRIRIRVRL
jgi:uncharacterized paraquat-inducible protein A